MRTWRLAFAIAGVALLGFGIFRLVTQIPFGNLAMLALWLFAAVVIHDGLLSPLVIGTGRTLERVPARARRYLQGSLIASAVVTVIALPLIYRRGSQPDSKALLQQNYAAHLGLLVSVIVGVCLLGYAVRVARDYRPSTSRELPAGREQRLKQDGEDDLSDERPLPPPGREQRGTE
jgi:hypothetical protein